MKKWMVAPSYANAKILKVDEKIKKAYIKEKCPRCGGLGIIVSRVENGKMIPIPVDEGICYQCNSEKYIYKWVKAYTEEELEKYLLTQKKRKEKKEQERKKQEEELLNAIDKTEEKKKKLLEKLGYDSENPLIWLVGGGNTYQIKDFLKSSGCKFCSELGWYNTHTFEVPESYGLVSINFFDVYDYMLFGNYVKIKDNAREVAEAALSPLTPESHSEYLGEIKERLRNIEATITDIRTTEGAYGTITIYTFKNEENVLVWFSSSCKDIKVGEKILLTGTVKDHKTYKGVKQTYLSRCLIKKEM